MPDVNPKPTDLSPCPFCGGEGHPMYHQGANRVCCKGCGVETPLSRDGAWVTAWNRRAPAAPLDEREALTEDDIRDWVLPGAVRAQGEWACILWIIREAEKHHGIGAKETP